jgi:hypothetical protein
MCTSPTKNNSEAAADSAEEANKKTTGSSCCPGSFSRTRRAARALVRKYCPKRNQIVTVEVDVVGAMAELPNNENLPPDGLQARGRLTKKKYTVNKKRSAKQSFDRLKKHVPTMAGKEDASQLDVLLEAIQYITALRNDLNQPQQPPPSTAAAQEVQPPNNNNNV